MSTCPEKDIHSLYIDNEIPLSHITEYESHVNNCQTCIKDLQKYKNLHSLLQEDSASINFSKEHLEDSFQKLQAKLHYSNTITQTKAFKPVNLSWVATVAAVLLLALVIPIKNTSTKKSSVPQTQPINIASSVFNNAISTVSMPYVGNTHKKQIKSEGIYSASRVPTIYEENIYSTEDVFRPDFTEKEQISVKITLSNLGEIPITTEFSFPMRYIIGSDQ
ncbi:MAG: hypothetical protein J6B32_06655 [Spirochaetaceae bacterium]|nr:hypothetical protein [Spirochaetaceae bacterium]